MRRTFFSAFFIAIVLSIAPPATAVEPMQLELEVFRVYYRKAADLVEPLKAVASRFGRLVAEEKSNTLIVRDYPPNMAAIKRLLKKLDVRPLNVSITVGFVDRRELRKLNMEVRWVFSDKNWSVGNVLSVGGRTSGMAVTPLIASEKFDSVNRQILLLLEHSEGEIFVGSQLPQSDYFIEFGTRHGDIKKAVTYKKVGASFSVIPSLLGDGRIELKIAPKLTHRSGDTINLAAARTVIIVDQNRTVIVAGNRKKSDSFGSRFFTSVSSGQQKVELVMTIKASVR